jgi:GxxExxY protein
MAELIYRDEAYAIVGAAMDVYYTMGIGFLEPIYHAAMMVELDRRRIPFESERKLDVFYKNVKLEKKYFADLVCYEQIVVELKVVPRISNIEVAQLLNYLKITRKRLGLLINFGAQPRLEWKRYVLGD